MTGGDPAAQPNSLGQLNAYQNGIFTQQSGFFYGIAATLYAQASGFPGGIGDVSNWVGMQNATGPVRSGDLVQVGIDSSNAGACGTGNGGGNGIPDVFFETQVNGNTEPTVCLTNYTFGIGSQTFFDIVWNAPRAEWDAYINWNNVWEFVGGLGPESVLTPGTAHGVLTPAEVITEGQSYNGYPVIGTINDQNAQLYANNGQAKFWEAWFTDIPATVIRSAPYCLYFPTPYTNVSSADRGSPSCPPGS